MISENMDRIKKQLKNLLDMASNEDKQTVFLIGNTAKKIDSEFYLTPIRNNTQAIVSGVIVYSEYIAKKIAKYIDGKVDYVFVDAEKKIDHKNSLLGEPGNIERAVKEEVKKSIFISYKGNDLTVDAADAFISEYFSQDIVGIGGKKVAVIGAGNIGAKLSLKLVERGAKVYLFRRSKKILKVIVDSINFIKPKYTDAQAYQSNSSIDACRNADVIIGTSDGVSVIDFDIINESSPNLLLIDVGKGSISRRAIALAQSKNIQVYRLSIENMLEGMIVSLISLHKTVKYKMGRTSIHGVSIVSGGLLAKKSEIVVDDCNDPKKIYGVGNGIGDFEVELDEKVKNLINLLNRKIQN
tara:strand:- start:274 stop:1335 length:1062 start_codon:yes stop_codon:yes gene_type:complete